MAMGVEAIVAVVATVVSAAAGAASAIRSGNQAEAAAEYQAQVADVNAQQAQMAAEAEAEDRKRRARYLLGSQLAATGASGVQVEGSPLLVMMDSAVQEDLEARRIRYRGYLQTAGSNNQAALARYEAGNYRTAGYMNAGTSLLKGGSTLAARKSGYGSFGNYS
jgi:hypothetical protein